MPEKSRTKNIYLTIAAMILFAACIPFLQAADHFTDDGFDAPAKTMQHPSSEYYNGVTYVAYQGRHEDAYVCAYNHNQKKWYGSYLAGVNWCGGADLNVSGSVDPNDVRIIGGDWLGLP